MFFKNFLETSVACIKVFRYLANYKIINQRFYERIHVHMQGVVRPEQGQGTFGFEEKGGLRLSDHRASRPRAFNSLKTHVHSEERQACRKPQVGTVDSLQASGKTFPSNPEGYRMGIFLT